MKTVEQIIAAIEARSEKLEKEAYEFTIESSGRDECLTAVWELQSLKDWILDEQTSMEEKPE